MLKVLFIYFTISIFAGSNILVAQPNGHLVIIGGGMRPVYIMETIVTLAGGEKSNIVIIPIASGEPVQTAEYQKREFEKLNAGAVNILYCTNETADNDSNLNKLKSATGIFFSGGDQNKLTAALNNTLLLESIKEIYNNGGVISGTSAGAAVMSKVMITGDEYLNTDTVNAFNSILKENIKTSAGFGFIDNAIIDQHFVKRKRHNRLISLVLENPHLLGIGIDEETAIIVKPGNTFEVIGEHTVIVYDASQSKNIETDANKNFSVENLIMHILSAGQKFDLSTMRILSNNN